MSGAPLSLEALERSFDEMWNSGHPEPHMTPPGPAQPARCFAELFTPYTSYESLRVEVIATGTPVHPDHAAYFAPVQGAAPLVCALEPHPEGTLHWDGRGTWWHQAGWRILIA